ncbi:MAG: hypothetical protein WC495_04970 [Patescibacteria group bacterium]
MSEQELQLLGGDVEKSKTVIFTGELLEYYHAFGNGCCIEWVKYV